MAPVISSNAVPVYDPAAYQWPGFARGRVPLAPVRVGVDRRTGKVLIGFPHVYQSMSLLFRTRFHTRILRPWVGSFVPHLLGNLATPRAITQFYWAIAGSLDEWEPGYRLDNVNLQGTTATGLQARGHLVTQMTGVYRPRGHLGDRTPESRKGVALTGSPSSWGP